jgi:hypothetical protein
MIQAVDEFIEDKKDWFKKLHKQFGDEETRDLEYKIPTNHNVPREADLVDGKDAEEVQRELREHMLALADKFEQDGEETLKKMIAIENGELEDDSDDSDGEEKWDCETILSTYTNTDNHPGVITTQKRVRTNQKIKIELHKQFRVPIEGLAGAIPVAEEILTQKDKKATPDAPFTKVEDSSDEGEKAPE